MLRDCSVLCAKAPHLSADVSAVPGTCTTACASTLLLLLFTAMTSVHSAPSHSLCLADIWTKRQ